MRKPINLSCVILARNEDRNIQRALKSVAFCDETIVIDDDSTDSTVAIAKKMGASVYKRSLANDFSGQRNYGLNKARGKWVLFLDADEVVSKDLAREMLEKIKDAGNRIQGFFIVRKDIIWDKILNYGESGDIKLLRLARKGSGKWSRKVHEVWKIEGETGKLMSFLFHYSHPNVREFIRHVDFMSSIHAEENLREGKKSSILKIILWPKVKFINNYIFKLGFLDGVYGFVAAIIMSFHSYLSWSKLWLIQKRTNKTKY